MRASLPGDVDKSVLIVGVMETATLSGGNPVSKSVRLALKGLALNRATELESHGVTALDIPSGFLRSEAMLDYFRVNKATWHEAGKAGKNFPESEFPLFIGRAAAALVADRQRRTSTRFGFLKNRFIGYPSSFLDLHQTGTRIQLKWLKAKSENTEGFLGQLPR